MKANVFLSRLLDKSEYPKKAELEQKINSLTHDIPDEFEQILPLLMSEQAARGNPNISEYHHNSLRQELTRAQTSKLQGAGFSEAEINEVTNLPIETRTERIIQLIQSKESAKYTQTESERIRALEAQAKAERDRADQLQASYAGREDTTRQAVEQVELRHQLHNLINSFQLSQNGLPRDHAVKVIYDEVNAKAELMGAKIIIVGGVVKMVQAKDKTLNFYDNNNNPVDTRAFVEKVAMDLNLIEKRKPVGEAKVFNVSTNNTKNTSQDVFNNRFKQLLNI